MTRGSPVVVRFRRDLADAGDTRRPGAVDYPAAIAVESDALCGGASAQWSTPAHQWNGNRVTRLLLRCQRLATAADPSGKMFRPVAGARQARPSNTWRRSVLVEDEHTPRSVKALELMLTLIGEAKIAPEQHVSHRGGNQDRGGPRGLLNSRRQD